MNGPEHYRKAEELLDILVNVERGAEAEPGIIAEAQVHATLALAAALGALDATEGPNGGAALGRQSSDAVAWEQVLRPTGHR